MAGVSVQALRQRIKRGSLSGIRVVVGGRVVLGVSRRELVQMFRLEQPTPTGGATTADLIVLRGDYRTMLVELKERARAAETRERVARRVLVPTGVALVLSLVALSATWTAWSGASARSSQLAEELPEVRAREQAVSDELRAAERSVGEGALATERALMAAREAQVVHDQVLALERERRQRAEAIMATGALRRVFGFR